MALTTFKMGCVLLRQILNVFDFGELLFEAPKRKFWSEVERYALGRQVRSKKQEDTEYEIRDTKNEVQNELVQADISE